MRTDIQLGDLVVGLHPDENPCSCKLRPETVPDLSKVGLVGIVDYMAPSGDVDDCIVLSIKGKAARYCAGSWRKIPKTNAKEKNRELLTA